eukprot:3417697-Rhodomonas_salina.1
MEPLLRTGSQCQPPRQRGARRKRRKREKKEKRGEGRLKASTAGRGGGSWPRPCRGPGRVASDDTKKCRGSAEAERGAEAQPRRSCREEEDRDEAPESGRE